MNQKSTIIYRYLWSSIGIAQYNYSCWLVAVGNIGIYWVYNEYWPTRMVRMGSVDGQQEVDWMK